MTEATAIHEVTGGQLAFSRLCGGGERRRGEGRQGDDEHAKKASQLGGTHGEVEVSFARFLCSLRTLTWQRVALCRLAWQRVALLRHHTRQHERDTEQVGARRCLIEKEKPEHRRSDRQQRQQH